MRIVMCRQMYVDCRGHVDWHRGRVVIDLVLSVIVKAKSDFQRYWTEILRRCKKKIAFIYVLKRTWMPSILNVICKVMLILQVQYKSIDH